MANRNNVVIENQTLPENYQNVPNKVFQPPTTMQYISRTEKKNPSSKG